MSHTRRTVIQPYVHQAPKIAQVASTPSVKEIKEQEEPREQGEEVDQDFIKPQVDIIGTVSLPRLITVKFKWIYSQQKCLAMDCRGTCIFSMSSIFSKQNSTP